MRKQMQGVLLALCLGFAQMVEAQKIEVTTIPLSKINKEASMDSLQQLLLKHGQTKVERIQEILTLSPERKVVKDGNIILEVYFKELTNEVKWKLKLLQFEEKTRRDNIILGWIPLENLSPLFEMEELMDVVVPSPILTQGNHFLNRQDKLQSAVLPLTMETEGGNPNNVYGFGEALNQSIASMKVESLKDERVLTGKGVKIGIISSSFNLLGGQERNVSSGDLPGSGNPFGFETPVTILEEGLEKNIPFGIDEGRGMAQLIHDIAPEAELFFHTGFVGSFLAYADAIQTLADSGCNIIVDDVAIFGTGSYQINEVSEIIAEIADQGVIYVSSAGNYGDGSSTNVFKFHERAYNPVGVNLSFGDFVIHQFDNGEFGIPIDLPAGTSQFNLAVQWSAPWASRCEGCIGSEGFNIFVVLVDANQNIIEQGVISPQRFGDAQVIVSDFQFTADNPTTVFALLLSPLEFTYLPERILLQHRPGASSAAISPAFSDDIFRASPTILNNLNTDEAIIVGASAWFNSPDGARYWNENLAGTELPNGLFADPISVPDLPILSYEGAPGAVFSSATGDPITTRSSVGGIQMFFDEEGLPLQTNAEGEAVPVVFQKPDIVGSDGVTNSSFGASSNVPNRFFFGTSASAPNVAGLVALLYQASNYTYDTEDMKRILIQTATDMDDPYINGFQASPNDPGFSTGFDFASGNGLVNAEKAIELLINEVGIKDISVDEVCSEDPSLGRRFQLINPNGFAIEAKVSSNRKFQLPTETEFNRGTRTFQLPPDTSFVLTDRSRFSTFTRFDVEANDADISRWISAPIPACESEEEDASVVSNTTLPFSNPSFLIEGIPSGRPSLSIAPNPSTEDITTATLGNLEGIPTQVQVLNLRGGKVFSTLVTPESNAHELMINLSDLRMGVYMIRITAGETVRFKTLMKR